MAQFTLGNFAFEEILYGFAFQGGEIVYALDQLQTASVTVNADSSDIVDKNGNVIRTLYKAKTGEFTSTNALLNPYVMNASSGSDIQVASAEKKISMPMFADINAGETYDLTNAVDGTVKVVGFYGNGAMAVPMTAEAIATATASKKFTAPAGGNGLPTHYGITYEEQVSSGMRLINGATDFPEVVKLVLFCSYVDACDEQLKACSLTLPKFIADPSCEIQIDKENQNIDLKGKLNVEYCGVDKMLYCIDFPDRNKNAIYGTVA